MPPKLPPKRQWLQPVRSGWEWIKYWNVEAILIAVVIFTPILIIAVRVDNWANWTGFGSNESVSTTVTSRDANGNVVETQTISLEPGKTFWDWLGLLGVPLTLAIFGYVLQRRDKQRDEKAAQIRDDEKAAEEKRISDGLKEEALQAYFDRISSLLVKNNLLGIASKIYHIDDGNISDQLNYTIKKIRENSITFAEREKLDAGLNVVRAQTLSILRRFQNDAERKGSVIRFLTEAEVTNKAGLDLVGADLSEANLSGLSLSYAKLNSVNFYKANLSFAQFISANLEGANLKGANCSNAFLSKANISNLHLGYVEQDIDENQLFTNFSYAYFDNANLHGSNFRRGIFHHAIITNTDLTGTDFREANLYDARLDGSIMLCTNLSSALEVAAFQLTGENPPILCGCVLPQSIHIEGGGDRDCDKVPAALYNRYPHVFKSVKGATLYVEGLRSTFTWN